MRAGLALTVTTPLAVVVAQAGVASVRAEDASGGFGIWPGHAALVTVLGASVLRWRGPEGPWRFCALRGGVLRVRDGAQVEIACREAVPGEDLAQLEALVRTRLHDEDDAARRARGERMRLHASAIRRLMQRLGPAGDHAAPDLAEEFR